MNSIGERIRELCESKNMKQADLAERMGMKTYTTVSKWENNDNFPKGRDLVQLAEVFGVTTDYILGLSAEKKRIDIEHAYNRLSGEDKRRVEEFVRYLSEGKGNIYNLGQTAAGTPLDYADSFLEKEELESVPDKADFVLTVKGDSMEPLIKNGSKVFVQSASLVENGEIAIVEIDGDGVTCKKIRYDYENQRIILESLNPKYPSESLLNGQIRIIGKVIR